MSAHRYFSCAAALLLPFASIGTAQSQSARHRITPVYTNQNFQLTGIAISKTGRFFVNFPRWSDRYQNAVIEVQPDGSSVPFPNADWNKWDLKQSDAGQHFVCVQSVVVDRNDALWVLDPAAPLTISPVPGGPKLVKIDLSTNQVSQVFLFDSSVILPDTYLNDVRFDETNGTAYITDSGHGGIVVLDLSTGSAHRDLDGDPSVLADPNLAVVVDGQPILNPSGKPLAFNSDSVTLSPDAQYLYYKAINSITLYRVPTAILRDTSASPSDVSASVQAVSTNLFPTDGLWTDAQGRIYLSDIDDLAVKRLLPDGTIESVVSDRRLQWTDTFTQGPDGAIYISASHINQSPTYNNGFSTRRGPYAVFRIDQ